VLRLEVPGGRANAREVMPGKHFLAAGVNACGFRDTPAETY